MKRIRKTLGAEVNFQHFNLVVDPDNPFEDYGWSEDDIKNMLYIEEFVPHFFAFFFSLSHVLIQCYRNFVPVNIKM